MIETVEAQAREYWIQHNQQQEQHPAPKSGIVYLIGAGPGDPELITVKGLRCLRKADVILYDRLISMELLDEAKPGTALIFVGKGPSCHTMKQEAINKLLVQHAQQGRIVVRLKGGDPFIFGRGGEEALTLAAAGIAFEIIPGISSAIAVPAYAGIPVTHRNHVSSVTIVTGHEGEHHQNTTIDWQALAKTGGTLVILMGVKGLPAIIAGLVKGGLAIDTPAAVIQEGTTNKQRVVIGTLDDIAQRTAEAKIKSPAITIIGTVVTLSAALSWYELAKTRASI